MISVRKTNTTISKHLKKERESKKKVSMNKRNSSFYLENCACGRVYDCYKVIIRNCN